MRRSRRRSAAPPGKLEKARLLAALFRGLEDTDLCVAATYFTGAAFPRHSGRVLQVGFAQLQAAAMAVMAFEAIQRSSRHRSGFALRFPRILRLRPDRTPADANSLEEVRRLYEQYRAVYEAVPDKNEGRGS